MPARQPTRDPAGVATPSDLEIRPATASDQARVMEVLFGSPSREAAMLAGGTGRASRLARALFALENPAMREILLAARGGRIVGALVARRDNPSFPVRPAAICGATAAVAANYAPWEIPFLALRASLRALVEFPVPPGSYHVAELRVDPEERGRGVGSSLLGAAIRRATECNCSRVNLATARSNPARRLYERAGFTISARREAFCYERVTRESGRLFMEKTLN